MIVTPLYAAAIALLFVGLSARTIVLRRRFQVALGSGGERALERAIRAHSNCAEYAPLTLLLLFFVEQQTGATVWVHLLAATLLIGRVTHALGLSRVDENLGVRTAGMVMTFTALGGAILGLFLVAGLALLG